jgi:broad specificity phosphatase PhoE
VREFFAHPSEPVFGPETADEAYARFAAAVDPLSATNGTRAVVAHGRVISLFVARRARVDAYELWLRLGLPSFVVLHLPDHTLVDVVERV